MVCNLYLSCACKLLMDCILLFSCLFLFFISSLIYLLTSTYFRASFFLFIIFIHLQNIPSLLFYVIVLNTMSVDLAYLLHVIGGGRERQEGGGGLKKKKKEMNYYQSLSFHTSVSSQWRIMDSVTKHSHPLTIVQLGPDF